MLVVRQNGRPLDIYNLPSKTHSETTIVFLHGAAPQDVRLPYFAGQAISRGLQANRVFISDPALLVAPDITIGWHVGDAFAPNFQSDLVSILERIVLAHDAKRVVFFGGSAGGFASLFYSSRFAGSLCVAYNPQTSLRRYIAGKVRDYACSAWNISANEYDPLAFVERRAVTDVCDLYSRPAENTVAILQNTQDAYHIERHFNPFVRSAGQANHIWMQSDDWGPEHTPPSKDVLRQLLERSVEGTPWPAVLAGQGFRRAEVMTC
jgi:pimeloyl-ACP methyl ester carboxylesterase